MHHAHYSLRLGTAIVTRPKLDWQYRKIVEAPPTHLVICRYESGQGLRGRLLANYYAWRKNNSNQNNNNFNLACSSNFDISTNFITQASYRQDVLTARWFKPNPKKTCCDVRIHSYFQCNSGLQASTGKTGRHLSKPFRLGCSTKCRSSLAILACKAMGKKDKAGLVESIRSRK